MWLTRVYFVCCDIQGIHSCEVLLGKAKICVQFTGAEVFEMIPAFPSMSKVRQACEEREKRSAFEEEFVTNEFASSPPDAGGPDPEHK